MGLRRLVYTLVLASVSLEAAKRGITMEDLLNSYVPEAPDAVWSPDGTAFVYERGGSVYEWRIGWNSKKLRIRLSELSAPEPKPEPSYAWQNRRVQERVLQWFPDSTHILVLKNESLFSVDDGSKQNSILTGVRDPKLSPDGKHILYRQNHNLFLYDVATRSTRQLTTNGTPSLLNGELDWVYPEELDLGTATWWSPDSKSFAFLQFDIQNEFVYPQTNLLGRRAVLEAQRYPQAGTPNATVRLAVFSVDTGSTTWMDVPSGPGVLLARVAWLPDSSRIAVEVMPRLQNKLDLLFCDVATGTAARVLEEQSRDWINVADNLTFLKQRPEFLWTSERSGFRHIYRYGLDGKLQAQLTKGDWQVDKVTAVDEAASTVYYTGSEGSPLDTSMWSVGIDGGQRLRLTQPGFDHIVKANNTGSAFLDHYSSLEQPPRTVIHVKGGHDTVLEESNTQATNLLPARIVKFNSQGTTFFAKLIEPAGFNPEQKYPAVVHVYGGPGAQQVRNYWSGADWDQLLASRGFVIWELDNRGSTGRGHAFETPLFHALGSQEIADQRAGVEYLLKLGFVDPKRIGVTGWSYGGYMTLRSLLLAPDLFTVGVAGAPVTDWRNYDTIYTERYMGLPEENAATYDRSSNVLAASKLTGKLLIVHNLEDDNVLFQNTAQMTDALARADRQYVLQVYPDRTHHVSSRLNPALYEAMTGFLERNLRPRTNVP